MNGDYNIVTRKGKVDGEDNGGNVFITCDSDINLKANGAIKLKGNNVKTFKEKDVFILS